MSSEPHNVMLDYLRDLRGAVGRIEGDIRDIKREISSIRSYQLAAHSDSVRQDERIDHIEADIERIKSRLDLRDA